VLENTELRPSIRILPQTITRIALHETDVKEGDKMAKKSRGGRMTAAKKRAAKSSKGKGRVKRRKAGRKVMER
jgi:hypothetical protein